MWLAPISKFLEIVDSETLKSEKRENGRYNDNMISKFKLTMSRDCNSWQHPFVDVLKYCKHDKHISGSVDMIGDAKLVLDKELGKRSWYGKGVDKTRRKSTLETLYTDFDTIFTY